MIGITRVDDDDELLMMTARGKIQRIAAREINVIGRNTKGVRIMSLDEADTLAALVRVPKEEESDEPPTIDGKETPSAEPIGELEPESAATEDATQAEDSTPAEDSAQADE